MEFLIAFIVGGILCGAGAGMGSHERVSEYLPAAHHRGKPGGLGGPVPGFPDRRRGRRSLCH